MKTKFLPVVLALIVCLATANANDKTPAASSSKGKSNLSKAALLADLTKNIEYATAKPTIRDLYYSKLDQLADVIKKDNYAVSLRGHADAIGGYKYNWVLSDDRAISVKKYLVAKGVKPERIVTTPFGSTVPIASNKTPDGRQKNRRVEIELKKIME